MTMNQEELTKLKNAINGLMTSMGAKRLDESGMVFWTLTLKEYQYQDVREALIQWAQTQHAVPRPVDIVECIKRKRVMKVEEQRKIAEEADRAERQADCQKIDVQAFIKKIHEATDNYSQGTLTSRNDANGQPYTKEEFFVRTVIAETSYLPAPKCYIERAKRFLQAEKLGINLWPMQISWAEKVLKESGIKLESVNS